MNRPASLADPNAASTPSLRRRAACFLYEGVLLFGVLMIAAYLFSSLVQQRHALASRTLLQGYLFLVLGIYFVWFWSHGGQTLAMKTWQIRLVASDGRAISQARALARYFLCWLWFMPALLVAWLSQTQQLWILITSLVAGVLIYAASCFMNADRQFLHDTLCATRLVTTSPTSPSRP
ncbi:MAG: RDD family protein [Burkholderiaceae bacterium]